MTLSGKHFADRFCLLLVVLLLELGRPLVASCQSTSTIDATISEIQQRASSNRDAIYYWRGRVNATDTSIGSTTIVSIDFAIDKVFDRDYFITTGTQPGKDGKSESVIVAGQVRFGSRYFVFSREVSNQSPRIVVRNHGLPALGLGTAGFAPMSVFTIMGDEIEEHFVHLNKIRPREWASFGFSTHNEIAEVRYGNKALNLGDIVTRFDLAMAGNLVYCFSPSPSGSTTTTLTYELINSVWVPDRVEIVGSATGDTSSVVFDFTHIALNENDPECNWEVEHLFRLLPGTPILDQTANRTFKYVGLQGEQAGAHFSMSFLRRPVYKLTLLLLLIAFVISIFILLPNSVKFISCQFWQRRYAVTAIAIICVCAIAVAIIANNAKKAPPPDPQCGHWCVYRACRELGVNANMHDIVSVLPLRRGGNSMLELRRALGDFGIETDGVVCDFEGLKAFNGWCIAQLHSPDHFILVSGTTAANEPNGVDGTAQRKAIPYEEIRSRWTGNLLVLDSAVSREAPLSGEPTLRFQSLLKDLGNIYTDQGVQAHSFAFVNNAASPVTIKDVHSSCDCLEARYPSHSLEIGEEGCIEVLFDSSKSSLRMGNFEHAVFVELATQPPQIFELTLAGRHCDLFQRQVRLSGSVTSGALG